MSLMPFDNALGDTSLPREPEQGTEAGHKVKISDPLADYGFRDHVGHPLENSVKYLRSAEQEASAPSLFDFMDQTQEGAAA